ncbi:MAG: roadblock/LC7 domain-containing protein [Nitrospirae bacterium]|nr:roadblock/LC7 domain-containing protein [Nitrospirota bacterium]
MSLAESLRRVVQELDEAGGVAIVGMDGIVVEEQKRDPRIDLQTLGAEFSGLFRSAGKLAESVEFGEVSELMTSAERSVVILRRVTAEYFLVLVIHPDGNLGKARFLLRRAGSQLKMEL